MLSRAAVVKFVEQALPDEKKCKKQDTGAEDAEMGEWRLKDLIGVEEDEIISEELAYFIDTAKNWKIRVKIWAVM